jgi:integral membrane protein
VKAALGPYRAMATIVGVLLIILCLIGLPLHYLSPEGSQAEAIGDGISQYLGVAHGWLYMIFLIAAFVLSRRAGWDLRFTAVTLLLGTVPVLSFWAEHRATRDVRARIAAESAGAAVATGTSTGR